MFDIPLSTGRSGSLHDQVFKDLIGRFLPDFLTLVAPEPAGRLDLSDWKMLNKEVFTDWPKGRRRDLDFLAGVPLAGDTAPLDELGRFLLANCVETYIKLSSRDAEELEALLAKGGTEEVRVMRRRLTWAEQIFDEGEEKGVRQTLLRMLGLRFGPLSDDVKRRVDEIHSVELLNQITDQILVARSLEEIGL